MSGLALGFIAGLLAAGSERGYDWTREQLTILDREAEYSLDLAPVETEFQRALEQRIGDLAKDEFAEPLLNAIQPWDVFVHELYGLESASTDLEELESEEHVWLTTETEDEVVERIVDTWSRLAECETDEPIPQDPIRETVVDAYRVSIRQFQDEISSTELADKALLESVRDLRRRLESLNPVQSDTNVYKSRAEFERLTTLLDERPEYVPVPAEREAIDRHLERSKVWVEDSQQELLRLLDEGVNVITVAGDGGSGKSRLLVEAGKALEERSEHAVYYVNTPEPKPLPANQDTVLFVDDAGRHDMEYYIRMAVPEHRIKSKRNFDVQVVAATRSVYDESVSRFVEGVGSFDSRTLWLQSPEKRDIARLLEQYDFDEETITQIVDNSDGNPLFALLLANLADKTGTGQLTLSHALATIIDEIISPEGDLGKVAEVDPKQAVERLLKWIAVHRRYIEPSDSDHITEQIPVLSGSIARRQQLDSLANSGYLDKSSTDTGSKSRYTHSYDVLSDYLRLDVIDDNQFYPYVQPETIQRKAVGIAQGIADLKSSPLANLYSDVQQIIQTIVKDLSSDVLAEDIPLQDTIEAERHLMRVAPSEIPTQMLRAEVTDHNNPQQIGDAVFQFVGELIQQIGGDVSSEEADKWLTYMEKLYNENVISPEEYGKVLSHAIRNYGNAGEIAAVEDIAEEIHSLPSSIAPAQFAVGLANAANIYARARHFESLETVLSELRDINREYAEADTQVALSMGLMNAAAGYGGAGYFDKMDSIIYETESHYNDNPQTEVAKYYAMALANAIADNGDHSRFDALSRRLESLRELYDQQTLTTIRQELAIGLYNAITSHAQNGNFEQVEELESELEDLYESSGDDAVRNELADALVDVAGYSGTEDVERATEAISKLENIHQTDSGNHLREDLARGWSNLIEIYRREELWGDLDDTLEDLRTLHSDYPESAIRNPFARSLMSGVARQARTSNWEMVDQAIDDLQELHTDHPTDPVRVQLASGLLYATEASLMAGRQNAVDEYVTTLLSLADSYGDLSGFAQNENFLPDMQKIAMKSLPENPETAYKAINLISKVIVDQNLVSAQVDFGQEINKMFDNDEIDSETYRRLHEHLKTSQSLLGEY